MNTWNERNKAVIEEFRANGGQLGGRFTGQPTIILHTTGAKSKRQHIIPVAYTKDGDRFVVIASKGGAPMDPDWYHNIVANPLVMIEVGTEKFQVRAAIAAEPERTRLYNQMAKAMPFFAEYQTKTVRTIPVIILTPLK